MSTSRAAIYRGAVVEDLQLPPAFTVPVNAPISRVLEAAFEREFSQVPVLGDDRRVLGYIEVPKLQRRFEAGEAKDDDPVSAWTTKFVRSKEKPYQLITPDTPLEELEAFLQENLFAIVTDHSRCFVLGVATLPDLETFVSRRGGTAGASGAGAS